MTSTASSVPTYRHPLADQPWRDRRFGKVAPGLADRSWVPRARCRDRGPTEFYPLGDPGRGSDEKRRIKIMRAASACYPCPVREQCYTYAVLTGQKDGIWGGVMFERGSARSEMSTMDHPTEGDQG